MAMISMTVSVRGTPYEWYFKARELVKNGELSEMEVNKALCALIAGADVVSASGPGEELNPCWGDVCCCMVHGWLTSREIIETFRRLIEHKKFRRLTARDRARLLIRHVRPRNGGANGSGCATGVCKGR